MSEAQFISAREVARRFGIGIATVWRWAAEGKFPAPVRFGDRCTRWRVADLERWAQGRGGAA